MAADYSDNRFISTGLANPQLDVEYTKIPEKFESPTMQRVVNSSYAQWKIHHKITSRRVLHFKIEPIVIIQVQERRMALAGHCYHHPEVQAKMFTLGTIARTKK